MSQKRPYILMIAVAGLLALFVLRKLAHWAILGPLEIQQSRIQTLSRDIAAKEKKLQQALEARAQLATWEQTSLPPDPPGALAMYQDFLFHLTQACQIEECKINQERRPDGMHSNRIAFNVAGRITLQNLTELLHQFERSNLLHQVRRLQIDRTGETGDKLEINLLVEGLMLHSARARDELLPNGSPSPVPEETQPELYAAIWQNNMFKPFRKPEVQEPKQDPAEHVRLTGCIEPGPRGTAWLSNDLSKGKWRLRPGDMLDVTGVGGKLLAVRPLGIVLEIGGQRWIVDIGKNLSQRRPATPAKKPANPSARSPIRENSGCPQRSKPGS